MSTTANSTLLSIRVAMVRRDSDDENHFTYSFAIFGPPGMPSDVVERLDASLRQALADPRTIDDAAAIGVPVVFNGPDVVRQTVERDLRVAKGVADYLR